MFIYIASIRYTHTPTHNTHTHTTHTHTHQHTHTTLTHTHHTHTTHSHTHTHHTHTHTPHTPHTTHTNSIQGKLETLRMRRYRTRKNICVNQYRGRGFDIPVWCRLWNCALICYCDVGGCRPFEGLGPLLYSSSGCSRSYVSHVSGSPCGSRVCWDRCSFCKGMFKIQFRNMPQPLPFSS